MRKIFVCGSLRKGEFNYERFEGFGDHLVATGTISGVQLKSLGDYPALVPSPNVTDLVVGEVYEISDGLGDVIDHWERDAGYEVRSVQVTSSDGELEAQAYFYSDPDRIAQYPVVEGGDWSLHKAHARRGRSKLASPSPAESPSPRFKDSDCPS